MDHNYLTDPRTVNDRFKKNYFLVKTDKDNVTK